MNPPGLTQVQLDWGRAQVKCLRAPPQLCFYSFALLGFCHPPAGMNDGLQRQRSIGAARRLPILMPSTWTTTRDGHGNLGLVPKLERRVRHVARLPRGTRLLISELVWLLQGNEGERGDKREAKGRAALHPCSTPATTAAQGEAMHAPALQE